MLEIKTITDRLDRSKDFDDKVNEAMEEGWELVRRDVLPPMAMRNGDQTYSVLYAELEREIEPEEDESENESVARWRISRNPRTPYKCSACGAECEDALKFCPGCGRGMVER